MSAAAGALEGVDPNALAGAFGSFWRIRAGRLASRHVREAADAAARGARWVLACAPRAPRRFLVRRSDPREGLLRLDGEARYAIAPRGAYLVGADRSRAFPHAWAWRAGGGGRPLPILLRDGGGGPCGAGRSLDDLEVDDEGNFAILYRSGADAVAYVGRLPAAGDAPIAARRLVGANGFPPGGPCRGAVVLYAAGGGGRRAFVVLDGDARPVAARPDDGTAEPPASFWARSPDGKRLLELRLDAAIQPSSFRLHGLRGGAFVPEGDADVGAGVSATGAGLWFAQRVFMGRQLPAWEAEVRGDGAWSARLGLRVEVAHGRDGFATSPAPLSRAPRALSPRRESDGRASWDVPAAFGGVAGPSGVDFRGTLGASRSPNGVGFDLDGETLIGGGLAWPRRANGEVLGALWGKGSRPWLLEPRADASDREALLSVLHWRGSWSGGRGAGPALLERPAERSAATVRWSRSDGTRIRVWGDPDEGAPAAPPPPARSPSTSLADVDPAALAPIGGSFWRLQRLRAVSRAGRDIAREAALRQRWCLAEGATAPPRALVRSANPAERTVALDGDIAFAIAPRGALLLGVDRHAPDPTAWAWRADGGAEPVPIAFEGGSRLDLAGWTNFAVECALDDDGSFAISFVREERSASGGWTSLTETPAVTFAGSVEGGGRIVARRLPDAFPVTHETRACDGGILLPRARLAGAGPRTRGLFLFRGEARPVIGDDGRDTRRDVLSHWARSPDGSLLLELRSSRSGPSPFAFRMHRFLDGAYVPREDAPGGIALRGDASAPFDDAFPRADVWEADVRDDGAWTARLGLRARLARDLRSVELRHGSLRADPGAHPGPPGADRADWSVAEPGLLAGDAFRHLARLGVSRAPRGIDAACITFRVRGNGPRAATLGGARWPAGSMPWAYAPLPRTPDGVIVRAHGPGEFGDLHAVLRWEGDPAGRPRGPPTLEAPAPRGAGTVRWAARGSSSSVAWTARWDALGSPSASFVEVFGDDDEVGHAYPWPGELVATEPGWDDAALRGAFAPDEDDDESDAAPSIA